METVAQEIILNFWSFEMAWSQATKLIVQRRAPKIVASVIFFTRFDIGAG
jgi:hypothetical protein